MYIKIHGTGKYADGNKGSCAELVNYLEKENISNEPVDILNAEKIGIDEGEGIYNMVEGEEYFFSNDSNHVNADTVIKNIDTNKKGLKKDEVKFYMITINPSNKELEFLSNSKESIREYTRIVMDEYARNFERGTKDNPLTGDDLVYYAKIENIRHYPHDDRYFKDTYDTNKEIRKEVNQIKHEIKENNGNSSKVSKLESKITKLEEKYIRNSEGTIILPDNKKDGLNTHVHVIVSRKDKEQKISLSPLAKSRGSHNKLNGRNVKIGFNRDAFVAKCEERFDKHFNYNRSLEDSYRFNFYNKHNAEKFIHTLIHAPTDNRVLAKRVLSRALRDNPELRKMLNMPTNKEMVKNKAINMAVNTIAKAISANPAGITVTVIKKAIQKSVKTVSKTFGMSIDGFKR